MSTQIDFYLSPEEYLAIERAAEFKSEYSEGVIYAMAGASEAHNLIAGNVVTELNNQLKRSQCKVYPSDMKVRLPGGKKFFYPDVSVVCKETQFADERRDVYLNPILVIEVLSESTAAYDRGKKWLSYQQIESLEEYILVAQDEPLVEQYIRQPEGGWLYLKAEGLGESVDLESVGCTLALHEIYAKVF